MSARLLPHSLITYGALDTIGSGISPTEYRNGAAVLWDALLEANCGAVPNMEHDLYVRTGTDLHKWIQWACKHSDVVQYRTEIWQPYYQHEIYYEVHISDSIEHTGVSTWVSNNLCLVGRCRVLSMLGLLKILPVFPQ